MNKSSLGLVAIFVASIVLTSLPAAYAMGVSGSILNIEVSPGDHISHKITVSLSGNDNATDFVVEVNDWAQSDEGMNAGVPDNPEIASYSARGFLAAAPLSFHLESNQSQAIDVEGDIPSNVGSGGRYAIISAKTISPGVKGNNALGLAYQLDTIIIFTIRDTEKNRTGEITNIKLDDPISPRMQNVTAYFKNTGNIHYKIKADAIINDSRGETLANASVPLSVSSVIPTATRKIRLNLAPENELAPGNYNLSAKVSLDDGTVLATKDVRFEVKPS